LAGPRHICDIKCQQIWTRSWNHAAYTEQHHDLRDFLSMPVLSVVLSKVSPEDPWGLPTLNHFRLLYAYFGTMCFFPIIHGSPVLGYRMAGWLFFTSMVINNDYLPQAWERVFGEVASARQRS